MNTVIYLVCLINLAGIVLIAILMDSHSRLHKQLKLIKKLLSEIGNVQIKHFKISALSHASDYWQLQNLRNRLAAMMEKAAAAEQYKVAGNFKEVIQHVDTLIEDFLNNTNNDDDTTEDEA